jgi:membrane-associated phospholipid phosphatase
MMALLCLHSVTASAAPEELPADILTGLLPLTSYAIAHFNDDDEGERQFLRSTAVSLVVNTSFRVAFNDTSWGERPNGSPYGFPSGHAGFVTSSAAFLQDRYGWKYGLPAYAVVGYVSYVRVDTGHHRWRDVAAGAAVSYGISKLFVTPRNATHIAPVIGPDFLGLRWERSF